MKAITYSLSFCVLQLFTFSAFLFAQNPIPNANFESWSGSTPVGWSATTNNPGFQPITKTTDAYSGSFAVHGEVLSIAGVPSPPVLLSGSLTEQNFPVSEHHQTFTGRYKFGSQGGDALYIEIVFAHTVNGGGAEGHAVITSDASSFEEVEIDMIYDANNPPGWQPNIANITVTILPPVNQMPHIGTWFIVDYFTFDGYPVKVEETGSGQVPGEFNLQQNYPNPFNPSTKINFSLPEESFATLKVFNLLGKEVATIVNEELTAGNYNADWDAADMPSGVYIYTLSTPSQLLSNKMLLLK